MIEPNATIADTLVGPNDCIVHITKGRTPKYIEMKFNTWSHAKDRDYSLDLKYWKLVRKFPWFYLFSSQFIRGNQLEKLRLYKLPKSVQLMLLNNTLDGERVQDAPEK